MDKNKLIIGVAVLVVILVAVIFKDRVKAAFMGFKINTDNRSKKNIAEISGNKNVIKQATGKKSGEISEENRARLKGDENQVDQG